MNATVISERLRTFTAPECQIAQRRRGCTPSWLDTAKVHGAGIDRGAVSTEACRAHRCADVVPAEMLRPGGERANDPARVGCPYSWPTAWDVIRARPIII